MLTLLGELVLWFILSLQSEPNMSIQLTMVMLPFMPLVCLVAILGAMLHVHDRFGPTATAPIILNGFMIAATVGFVGVFANPMETHDSDWHLSRTSRRGTSGVVAPCTSKAWMVYS